MTDLVFFYIFAAVLIISGIRVVTAKNPVHSVLFLILAFITSSCLWMMLHAEFLSIILILVYVGAVMVLFLFVVMMLDVDVETMRKGFWKNLPLAIILAVVVVVEMVMVVSHKPQLTAQQPIPATIPNSNLLGAELYVNYSYPVELASIILLLGFVVAVALTLRNTGKSSAKYQNIPAQVKVKSSDRFKMVKIPPSTDSKVGE